MKILILVLSFNEPPFSDLMKCQQSTWDSVEVEGVDTVYYYGGGKGWNGKEFSAKSNDKYYYMHDKLKECLQCTYCQVYDYIFRTNSSSYVNKKELLEFVKTLPKEKLYAGWKINGNEGFDIVSGAGFFVSKDTAKILMDNIDPTFEKEEDYYCAKILHEHGIEIIDDKSRYDYTGGVLQQLSIKTLQPYHIRFKTDSREQDIENMKIIHKLITE